MAKKIKVNMVEKKNIKVSPYSPYTGVLQTDTAHDEISKKLQSQKGIDKDQADVEAGKILSAASKKKGSEKPTTEKKENTIKQERHISDEEIKKIRNMYNEGNNERKQQILSKVLWSIISHNTNDPVPSNEPTDTDRDIFIKEFGKDLPEDYLRTIIEEKPQLKEKIEPLLKEKEAEKLFINYQTKELPSNYSSFERVVGNTYPFREQLKKAGYKWDQSSKTWSKS